MNPGMYDRTIIIERPTVVNTNGSVTKTWAVLHSKVPAWKRPTGGNESVNADKFESVERAIWQTPYFNNLTVKDRIKDGTNYWNIESITEVGRRDGYQITARLND